jgi:plasmid stabilization system protein ParE
VRLRFTPQAQKDIEKIYAYLHQRSPSGAYNVAVAIYAADRFVAERPKASPLTENPDVRVKVLRRYRYKMFYHVFGGTVEIVHVRHASRRAWKGVQ